MNLFQSILHIFSSGAKKHTGCIKCGSFWLFSPCQRGRELQKTTAVVQYETMTQIWSHSQLLFPHFREVVQRLHVGQLLLKSVSHTYKTNSVKSLDENQLYIQQL
ncbi:hypothetical protein CHARACLAT_029291 [Characodon lateralis]|uniref:Uncharacterized protein n=1 Tax=Characodon lateralis TaxID=208331 RepID=A0ABU7CS94_9TELE|nr:hypothetical protein [Characodon lateralis]